VSSEKGWERWKEVAEITCFAKKRKNKGRMKEGFIIREKRNEKCKVVS